MFFGAIFLLILYLTLKYIIAWITYFNTLDPRLGDSTWRFTYDYPVIGDRDISDLDDKNFVRLNYELNIPEDQNHNFTNFPYYWIDNVKFEEKIINNIKVYSTKGMCWNIPTTCIRGVQYINLEKKNNYIFYNIK